MLTDQKRAFIKRHAKIAVRVYHDMKAADPFHFPPQLGLWFWQTYLMVKYGSVAR